MMKIGKDSQNKEIYVYLYQQRQKGVTIQT